MKKMIFILGLFGLGCLIFWIWNRNQFFLNPLSYKNKEIKVEANLEVFGFLPTWMVGKTREYTDEISHLIFLGIEVDEKGDLVWDTQSKKINNESYLEQKRVISDNGGKNILGIKQFDDNKLRDLLESDEARGKLVNQVKKVVEENSFDGVNLDFEYQTDPLAILSDDFGLFLDELKISEVGEISVDVFANTVIKGKEKDLAKMINKIDHLVVMAYDFSRPGVNCTGAVAPIGSNAGERNIGEVVERYLLSNLDKNKMIMAFPLYGYEWKTETTEFRSKIKRGWYQMASWNRTKEVIKEKDLEVNWDELSMSPWITFEEEKEIHQIYFENERSLGAKIDLVRQNQFKGYGFWALGYEGEDEAVWNH